jgi:hypothetical protein
MKKLLLGGLTAAMLIGGAAFADDAMNQGTGTNAQPGDVQTDATMKKDKLPGTGMSGSESTAIDKGSDHAQLGTQEAPTSMGDQAGAMNMQGTITKAKKDKLTVKGQDGKKQQVFLDNASTILRDGKVISARDLKKGDDVRVSFDQRGNKIFATTISATSGMGDQKMGQDKMGQDQKMDGQEKDKVKSDGSSITQPVTGDQSTGVGTQQSGGLDDPSMNGNTPGTQYRKESGRTNPNTNNAGVKGNIGVQGQGTQDPGAPVNPPSNPDTK